jgi:hypothetical protein
MSAASTVPFLVPRRRRSTVKKLPVILTLALLSSFVAGPDAFGAKKASKKHPPLSGIAQQNGPGRPGGTHAPQAKPGDFTNVPISVGPNESVIVGDTLNTFEHDSGPACFVGDETPQNETVIAHNPQNPDDLVGGANDYRTFVDSEQRYDGAGTAYVSHNGGVSWTNVTLPGIHEEFGGTYQAVGDPVTAWDPDGSAVYYANIAFNRTETVHHSAFASAITVSRSTTGGDTWTTSFVVQDDDPSIFHDKEWLAVAPNGDVYVAWARFRFGQGGPFGYLESPIVISKSTDDGQSWSEPEVISVGPYSQFAVPQVAPDGTVYVSYENWKSPAGISGGRAWVARSTDGGETWTNHFVGLINDLRSPLPGSNFRVNSGPVLTVGDDGTLHNVWANWQGGSGDIVYTRSSDQGETWTKPVKINQESVKSDQFFPWIDATGDFLHVGFVDRQYTGDELLDHSYAVSTDGGDTWSQTERVTEESSRSDASLFGVGCTGEFIGDYTGITAVGNTAQVLWMDGRPGTQPVSPSGDDDDQDAFIAEVIAGPVAGP